MGLFDFLRGPDIDQGISEYHSTPNALLVDVRTPEEYRQGHIPGSRSIPLQTIGSISAIMPDKSQPVFVYCLSGARSRQAAAALAELGYTNVKNIGGIGSYHGKVER